MRLNDANVTIPSHSILRHRDVHVGHEHVHLTNLSVAISNTPDLDGGAFNYLCDYERRFSPVWDALWTHDADSCLLKHGDNPFAANETEFTWLGTADPTSSNWTDYKLEDKKVKVARTRSALCLTCSAM